MTRHFRDAIQQEGWRGEAYNVDKSTSFLSAIIFNNIFHSNILQWVLLFLFLPSFHALDCPFCLSKNTQNAKQEQLLFHILALFFLFLLSRGKMGQPKYFSFFFYLKLATDFEAFSPSFKKWLMAGRLHEKPFFESIQLGVLLSGFGNWQTFFIN